MCGALTPLSLFTLPHNLKKNRRPSLRVRRFYGSGFERQPNPVQALLAVSSVITIPSSKQELLDGVNP